MSRRHKNKTIGQKAQSLKRKVTASAMSFTPLHFLIKNRRAVSAVMSNLILIGAVMAVGLVVLSYARSTSINYQVEYGQTVTSDINKLKESLCFEYVFYNTTSKNLYVYFLNSGTINVEVDHVSVNASAVSFSTYQMNNQAIPNPVIASGQEGYLVSNINNLVPGIHSVKLTSGSESTFAYNFLV